MTKDVVRMMVLQEISDADYANVMLDLSPMPVKQKEAPKPRGPSAAELVNDLLM